MSITYQMVYGGLPSGIDLDPKGLVHGTALYDAIHAPIWETPPGELAVADEFAELELPPLVARSQPGRQLVRYSIVKAHKGHTGLPWGLKLDPKTGVISGYIAELLDELANPLPPSEIPIWNTPKGLLGTWGEFEEVEIELSATPQLGERIVRWFIVKGALPWGLTIDTKTGVISGTTAELVHPISYVPEEFFPKPVWKTPTGSLGIYNEFQTISLQLDIQPRLGSAMKSFVITEGFLPWGLVLDRATGVISGTAAELKTPFEPVMESPMPRPTWNTQKGCIGIYREQDEIDVQVSATPHLGTTLTYMVISGGLPWGCTMDRNTGRITGVAAEIKIPVEPEFYELGGPTWLTPSGKIATLSAGQTVDFSFDVKGENGRTIKSFYMNFQPGGGLPWGVVFSPSEGKLAGTVKTNAKPGVYNFVVVAVDSADREAARDFSIEIV
jgi:Putative Ig domain.